MKVSDVVALERNGSGVLHLHKEGKFYRAWEQSAQLFFTNFKSFKLIRRYFKNQNEELVYLGFPESSLAGFLGQASLKNCSVEQEKDHVRIIGLPSLNDFETWKAEIAIEHVTVVSAEVPEPASHKFSTANKADFLPAYKLGYDCVLELTKVSEKLPREHRFTLGEGMRKSSLVFLLGLWKAAAGRSKLQNLADAEDAIDETRLLLRISCDLKLLDLQTFARVSQNLDMLARQILAWRIAA